MKSNKSNIGNSYKRDAFKKSADKWVKMEDGGKVEEIEEQIEELSKEEKGRLHKEMMDEMMECDKEMKDGGKVLSPSKAKAMLKDGTAHGKPITDKQRRYFGWVAGGRKMIDGGSVVDQWDTENTFDVLKDTGQGALTGATLGSAIPVIGPGLGAVVGAGVGGGMSVYKNIVGNEAESIIQRKAEQEKAYQDSLDKWLVKQSYKQSFKDGGKIEGNSKGIDNENMVAEDGGFICPKMNAHKAMAIGRRHLGWKRGEEADKTKGDVKLKVTPGEVYFTPEEVETLKKKGVDLNKLAPNADNKVEMVKGGMVDGDIKTLLEDAETGDAFKRNIARQELYRMLTKAGKTDREAKLILQDAGKIRSAVESIQRTQPSDNRTPMQKEADTEMSDIKKEVEDKQRMPRLNQRLGSLVEGTDKNPVTIDKRGIPYNRLIQESGDNIIKSEKDRRNLERVNKKVALDKGATDYLSEDIQTMEEVDNAKKVNDIISMNDYRPEKKPISALYVDDAKRSPMNVFSGPADDDWTKYDDDSLYALTLAADRPEYKKSAVKWFKRRGYDKDAFPKRFDKNANIYISPETRSSISQDEIDKATEGIQDDGLKTDMNKYLGISPNKYKEGDASIPIDLERVSPRRINYPGATTTTNTEPDLTERPTLSVKDITGSENSSSPLSRDATPDMSLGTKLGLANAALGVAGGIYQTYQAQKKLGELAKEEPQRTIPTALLSKYGRMQREAAYGFDPYTMSQAKQDQAGTKAAMFGSAQDAGSRAAIATTANKSFVDLMASDEQLKAQKRRELGGVESELAGAQDSINKYKIDKWWKENEATADLMQAGLSNIDKAKNYGIGAIRDADRVNYYKNLFADNASSNYQKQLFF